MDLHTDLNEALVFTQVVRSGSFTGAARALGIQKSGVSRRVSELEERLGARLLQRTTRSLHLTDEGRLYYEHCARALSELEEAEQRLSGMRATPRGLLRVTAPLSFGFVGAFMARYLTRHPEVQVELVCTDRVVNLVEEGFDLAIRAGALTDSTLIARRLGVLPRMLVASPAYLRKRAPPRAPEDSKKHPCLLFGSRTQGVWRLLSSAGSEAELTVVSRLVVNDYDLLREATIAGLGVALLPEYGCTQLLADGRLMRVLPEWSSQETPIHALYPSTRHLSSKVRALLEVLRESFQG